MTDNRKAGIVCLAIAAIVLAGAVKNYYDPPSPYVAPQHVEERVDPVESLRA